MLETLKSVQQQTYPLAEIYVVDDGSADETGIKRIEDYVRDTGDLSSNVIVHRSEKIKESVMHRPGPLKDQTLMSF